MISKFDNLFFSKKIINRENHIRKIKVNRNFLEKYEKYEKIHKKRVLAPYFALLPKEIKTFPLLRKYIITSIISFYHKNNYLILMDCLTPKTKSKQKKKNKQKNNLTDTDTKSKQKNKNSLNSNLNNSDNTNILLQTILQMTLTTRIDFLKKSETIGSDV